MGAVETRHAILYSGVKPTLLVDRGLDPNEPDEQGVTHLYWAIEQDSIWIANGMIQSEKFHFTAASEQCLKLATKKSTQFGRKGNDAYRHAYEEIVNLLLKAKAKSEKENQSQHSASATVCYYLPGTKNYRIDPHFIQTKPEFSEEKAAALKVPITPLRNSLCFQNLFPETFFEKVAAIFKPKDTDNAVVPDSSTRKGKRFEL